MLLKYLLPGLSWAIFILLLCGLPPNNIGEFNLLEMLNPDKLFHFGMFAIMALILIVGLKRQYSFLLLRSKAIWFSVGFSIVYGIIIEGVQILYFDGREGDLLDIIANTLGAFFGIILFKVIYGNTRISTS